LQEVLEEGIILSYNFTGAIKNCTFFYFKFKQGMPACSSNAKPDLLKIVTLFFYSDALAQNNILEVKC